MSNRGWKPLPQKALPQKPLPQEQRYSDFSITTLQREYSGC